jgi:hypothetical protein
MKSAVRCPERKVPLRRRRIARAQRDVSSGRKDTERRGKPSDVPAPRRAH